MEKEEEVGQMESMGKQGYVGLMVTMGKGARVHMPGRHSMDILFTNTFINFGIKLIENQCIFCFYTRIAWESPG